MADTKKKQPQAVKNPYQKVVKDVEADKAAESEEEKNNASTLMIAFLLMLVFALGNRIFGKLQTYPMYNYPLFMNMLSVVLYVPLCFAYIIPMVRMHPDVITLEQIQIPKYKFAVMGAYDSLAGIMQVFAVNYITNSGLIVLVQQSAIPISMIVSKITLNSTYTTSQYVGAGIVLLGIVVVLIPQFAGGSGVTANALSAAETNAQLMWMAALVVSCVPMCLSSVYKEKALGEIDINIVYLNGWVAVFQLALAVPLAIPSAMVINLPIADIPANFYAGFLCWFGINTVTEDYNPNHQRLDECGPAPIYVTAYLFFNIVYNYLIVVILKLGSANILWMASTVIVPLSNVVFSLQFMPNHAPMKFIDIVGLVVIMSGLLVYRFTPQLLQVYDMYLGKADDFDDSDADTKNKMNSVSKTSVKRQAKYVGINQMESLNAVIDTRIVKDQKTALHKSTTRIRSSFLAKIGIPPSPLITMRGSPSIGGAPSPSLHYTASPLLSHTRNRPTPSSQFQFSTMQKPHSFIGTRSGVPIDGPIQNGNGAAAGSSLSNSSPMYMINARKARENAAAGMGVASRESSEASPLLNTGLRASASLVEMNRKYGNS